MNKQILNIDRSSSVPLYKQIKEILIEEIRASDSDPLRPISTEEELVQRFHVSRAPVRQALKELTNEGYVYRERAKGTFPMRQLPVRPPGLELGGLVGYLREQGMESKSFVLDIGRMEPPNDISSILGLEPNDKVLKVSRLILVQEKPLVWTQTYLCVPEDFQPNAEQLEEAESVFMLLEREQGISLSRGEQQMWATAASIEEAKKLSINDGEPVLIGETKLYTHNDRLIGWRRAVHRADDYKYTFTVNR
ncbi:GntR family transcriptional regulator [Oceanobacillus rekensis]|uniref:GntR family transcriptional regulator n=1 Tax=Oceanobacillus rekensis TaxID=937927 RepID=UPI00159310E5|nr:GntR family transcriptional regulator [Oceanobacillus rekensis]